MIKTTKINRINSLDQLITSAVAKTFPKINDAITGRVVSIGKNEVIVDIPGLTTGIIRGWELEDESGQFNNLKVDDEVRATVLDLENERGMMELSFRLAGHKQAWDKLDNLKETKKIITVKAIGANKGGLIIKLGQVLGFLPVSQLSAQHYPRIGDGNKSKILEKLKTYINKSFQVKIIDVDEVEEKLIVSEKAIEEVNQLEALANYHVGDELAATITGIVDFGLFVALPISPGSRLDSASLAPAPPVRGEARRAKQASQDEPAPSEKNSQTNTDPATTKVQDETPKAILEKKVSQALEGLIHISEISWQRVDNLKEIYKIGDKLKAKIIDIDNTKISLSIKRLLPDPWQEAARQYQVGQEVTGKVIKINNFGAFVELAHNIHGLAHTTELNLQSAADSKETIAVGNDYNFKIINFEPKEHRLGLSRKALEVGN